MALLPISIVTRLAKRTQRASLIHFAALELRYGIEYLLFELLVLSVEALDEKTYQKCIGDPHEMKKMLGKHGANYEKLAKFTTVVVSLSNPQFKVYVWDIAALFATWGVASEFLHFVGIHRQRQENLTWIIESIARLETQLDPIWKAITETHAAGVMTPSRMVPKVRGVWEDFVSGKLSLDDVTLRLKIHFPNAWMSGTQIIGI